MERALYADGTGFFVAGGPPARHFRTSVHASPLFVRAIGRLLGKVDEALGRPSTVDVVDVGAGGGELLVALPSAVPEDLAGRLRLTAVERAPRPATLPASIGWQETLPARVTGLLLATEWLERWWPLASGTVAEIGVPRDEAWRAAVSTVDRGLALCVDYGHLRATRPAVGTLCGYRYGRQVPPVPDGSCDLTAHVAVDALATPRSTLMRQRDALRALGVTADRPPRALAGTDPAGYARALADATGAAELTDPAGLGGHFWLLEPVGIRSAP